MIASACVAVTWAELDVGTAVALWLSFHHDSKQMHIATTIAPSFKVDARAPGRVWRTHGCSQRLH